MDFRGVTAAALLKRRNGRYRDVHQRRFPRRHCRGPIEASGLIWGKASRYDDFRGVTAAALLKLRELRQRTQRQLADFRGVTAAALLKQETLV